MALQSGMSFSSAGGNLVIGGVISGSPVTILGPGATILTASNTYTGGTTITSGVLAVGADSNLGSGPVTISAGALEITGSILSPRSMVLTGPTATVQIDATGNYIATAGATVSGSGGLTKSGPGTLDLTNATISYTGSTSVIGGILSVGSLAGNSALSVAGSNRQRLRRQPQPGRFDERGCCEFHGLVGDHRPHEPDGQRQHHLRLGNEFSDLGWRSGHHRRTGGNRHGQRRDRQSQRPHGDDHEPGQCQHQPRQCDGPDGLQRQPHGGNDYRTRQPESGRAGYVDLCRTDKFFGRHDDLRWHAPDRQRWDFAGSILGNVTDNSAAGLRPQQCLHFLGQHRRQRFDRASGRRCAHPGRQQ